VDQQQDSNNVSPLSTLDDRRPRSAADQNIEKNVNYQNVSHANVHPDSQCDYQIEDHRNDQKQYFSPVVQATSRNNSESQQK
jgi:hypothetical protein